MRKAHIFSFGVFCAITVSLNAGLYIEDIIVQPSAPTPLDTISIEVQILCDTTGYSLAYTEQQLNGTDIDLSLYIQQPPPDAIIPPVITDISHIFTFNNLPVGLYSVNALAYDFPSTFDLLDTSGTTFTVVPEPTTLVLLTVGSIAILRKRRKA